MKKTIILLCWLLPSYQFTASAQGELKEYVSVSAGAGTLLFNGDVGADDQISALSKIRMGYNLSISKRFAGLIGVNLNATMGKLSGNTRSSDLNLNFESTIRQYDATISLHLDNGFILPKDAIAAPYIFIGYGMLKFDPYGDLFSSSGKPYYYWKDGGIYDRPETGTLIDSLGLIVKRDYVYETKLTASENYKRSTFVVPAGIGVKLRLTDKIHMNLNVAYNISMSDFIDNYKANNNTDNYYFGYANLQYVIGKRVFAPSEVPKEDTRYKDVDFTSLENADEDGDGVKDVNDECPNSPKGTKVDSKGCPKDGDGDGVPDHLDKEPNTKKGALVDENGTTLTDEMIAQRWAMRDSVQTVRNKHFEDKPGLETLKEIDTNISENKDKTFVGNNAIPADLRPADYNKDGFISSDEISKTIDNFFEGDSPFTVEKIGRLIDYFFEQ